MPIAHLTTDSRHDIVEIVLHIRQDNPRAAKRVLDAIHETLELLMAFPAIGPRRNELAANLRSFPVKKFTNYIVFYRPISNGIKVIRVLHGMRNLPAEFK